MLRPLLACRWIERGLGHVPVVFQELVDAVLEELPVRQALDELLALKSVSQEVALYPQVAVLAEFVAAELARLEALTGLPDSDGDLAVLNSCFRRHARLEFS